MHHHWAETRNSPWEACLTQWNATRDCSRHQRYSTSIRDAIVNLQHDTARTDTSSVGLHTSRCSDPDYRTQSMPAHLTEHANQVHASTITETCTQIAPPISAACPNANHHFM